MKKMILVILLLTLLSFCGDYKKLAIGRDERITTIVNESLWSEVSDTLKKAIEYTIKTPQTEKIFYFDVVPYTDFNTIRYNKTIMLITTMDQNDETSKFIKSMMSQTIQDFVMADKEYMFPIRDHIAQRQLFVIIAAPTKEKLLEFLRLNQDRIYMTIDKAFIDRQMDQLYYKAEEKELSEKLLKDYGFTLRFPNDYKLIHEDKLRKVIQIGKSNPYRWITIYWRSGGFKSLLDDQWAWKTRSWIGNQIMEETYIESKYITTRKMYWEDQFISNMRGLWGHKEKAMGGPFSVFYFYDGATDRIFFIDLSVWAPGESKNVYLRQMELVASSFKTRKSIKKEE